MDDLLTLPGPDEIAALFTRTDGTVLCARWRRPIAVVIFGWADGGSEDELRTATEAITVNRGACGGAAPHPRDI
ncbi:hypothetical protein FNJ84_08465 [Paracoccus sp. M683]|uniref:hypothetical protein n=1 Tax=Paracoccus sp. M683 TaxID=2594268 RepID=UPI00117ED2D3|nr:hypothetical protein [Paracoccus sp. M683]TRW97530.1 hypothetical protein FNJ84_08465 [Paracoccus sp. M683]